MSRLTPIRGDRPSIAPKPRQERRTSYPDGSPVPKRKAEPIYKDASEWPSHTPDGFPIDDVVLTCAVPAAEWPAWTDRVAFAPNGETVEGR